MKEPLSRIFCLLSPRHRRAVSAAVLGVTAGALAALAAASHAAGQSRQPDTDPRVLVGELAEQLRLVYRDNLPEYARRYEQLREAINAWNASPRSAADRQLMTTWLRDSIHSTLPGTGRGLPPLPKFGQPPATIENAPARVTVRKPVAAAVAPTPVDAESNSPASPPAAKADDVLPPEGSVAPAKIDEQDFWSRHPAAGALPAEFSEGDPFRDDPLPENASENDSSSGS
jgi:hypothetical protein